MEYVNADCIFKENSHISCAKEGQLSNITYAGLRTILKCSKIRKDTLTLTIPEIGQVDEKAVSGYKCHKTCKATYISKDHIKRYKGNQKADEDDAVPHRCLRSGAQTSSFIWKQHCVFCGEDCPIKPTDPKNPSRWREAYESHTSDRGKRCTFKDAILISCDEREDKWSDEVRTRLSDRRSSYDLHSADARYHEDCRKNFMRMKKPKLAEDIDEPYNSLLQIIEDDPQRMWTSLDLESAYKENDGVSMSRKKLVDSVLAHFGNKMIILTSPGLADMVIFRKYASSMIRLQEDDNEIAKNDEKMVARVAKKILGEVKAIEHNRTFYRKRIDVNVAMADVSPTLLQLLSYVSPQLSNCSLPSIMIGNIVTSRVMRRATSLLVALSIFIREKKKIEHLYDYGVVCSYDETKIFRSSAAVEGNRTSTTSILKDSSLGLVQVVGDNFDCNISSQNGLRQTHSLAMVMTQESVEGKDDLNETFPRLKRSVVKDTELKDPPVIPYQGPKKPDMPPDDGLLSVPPLRVLAGQIWMSQRAKELDFEFMKEITSNPNTPEYSGFNTKRFRETGHSMSKSTEVMYTPLINMKPSDPTTMLTAVVEAQRLTHETGQKHTIFTSDQQLYKILCDIKWAYPKRFEYLIPRLGGMHLLMSFVGCVGVLMQNTGLVEILQSAFSGVPKMLLGKNFPNNVRALRMVVEELLRTKISGMEGPEELDEMLDNMAQESKTSKLWVDCLVKPVFIMMMFVRAEREGEWLLHLHAVRMMIPYFFSAGHQNYARYGLHYLRDMEKLPSEVLKRFMKGEHVMRHQAGYWNAIWSDMLIETTFMRYGKGPGGLIGITLNEQSVKKWANGLHICTQILNDLEDMRGEKGSRKDKMFHKEEMKGRIESDRVDRQKIQKFLEHCVDPLDPKKHPTQLVNVYNGMLTDDSDVFKAVSIGKEKMKSFEEDLPQGFYSPISKAVKTMAVGKKHTKIQGVEVYNTEIIYMRVMGLLSTGVVKLEDVLKYELSPIPLSLFKECGEMRASTNKSELKKLLQVVSSKRNQVEPKSIVIDGCALLWTVHWPSVGTVKDIASAVYSEVLKHLKKSNVYLIFDRYFDFSAKGGTRKARAHNIQHQHQFDLNTPLPKQDIALTSTSNKVQLIELICAYLVNQVSELSDGFHKLIVTGADEYPIEVTNNTASRRVDLRTTQEEADIIIVQQVFAAVKEGDDIVKVICDDTDVFVLLSYFVHKHEISSSILMEATHNERTIIDINATVAKYEQFMPSILALHALTGCDTVPKFYGIGKRKAFNALVNNNVSLVKIGDVNTSFSEVMEVACRFIGLCYGVKSQKISEKNMSFIRVFLWNKRTKSSKLRTTPKLCGLPPTHEVFTENIKRGISQCIIWENSLSPDPPALDLCEYGYYKDTLNRMLRPVMIPTGYHAVPPEVLKVFHCNCCSNEPCSTNRCSCAGNKLPCSMFCVCYESTCYSSWTVKVDDEDGHEESEDEDLEDN